MAIYEHLVGVGGRVVLLCMASKAPAQDAKSTTILKVYSKCGTPLGEWETESERDAELKEFEERVKNTGVPTMKILKIRISSGQHAGRYIGAQVGPGSLRTNPDLIKNPEVPIPGTEFSLYVQEEAATKFVEGKAGAVQAELRKLGYESELVAVQE